MKNSVMAFTIMLVILGCSSQQPTANKDNRMSNREDRRQPPSIDEIFKMDTNKDGKLSKSELKGPLLNDFSRVDSNNDGFISRTELENAPQPQRGERPPRNN